MYMYKECKVAHKDLCMGGMLKPEGGPSGEDYAALQQFHSKAALVWSPAPDPHAKSSALAAPTRPPSPASSGLVHWMSMMADHPHMNPPHSHDVHYMWNGVETKMNPTDQHNPPSMQKGTNGSSHVNKYQAGRYKKRQPFPAGGGGHDGPWSSKDFLDDRRASCADSRRTAESPESGATLATDFVHWPQPAFRGPGTGLEDPRPGSMESPQMHSMYGNHGSHGNRSNSSSSNSPPVSVATTSASMLVVPQPINAIAKPTLNAAAAAAANGSGRKYQCKMCPQIFLHKSAMQHHAREVHRGELKPHQCQQCLKSFSSNHQLVQHIRIHTGEKPYKCSYCERRFKQLSHVQQHTRLHTGERPYKCHLPECGRAFIQLSNLQQHLRNHDNQVERSKNRPFHCSICGKGFASESSLRTHTSKQHAALIGGQNSQSCPVCHKMFLGSEALMDHMRTAHKDPNATGVASKRRTANHPCPVCGKTYVNEGSLRKHIASHPETSSMASPLRMWPCSVCQSVFTQESGLLSHMEHMRMDPKHQFAAQYVLSRAAAERRERESLLAAAAAAAVAAASGGPTNNGLQPTGSGQNDHHSPNSSADPRSQQQPPPPPMGMPPPQHPQAQHPQSQHQQPQSQHQQPQSQHQQPQHQQQPQQQPQSA